ncbi:MAG: serine/threonine protein kinase [Thermoanaerobaculia bacterium]
MATTELVCLRCKTPLAPDVEACPQCSEKVTQFQRTYSAKLIDGKYQILDRLGVGGMGEIFKVRHIHLGEQRVIKIMRANIASDDQALQRFLAEAKLATTVKHRSLAMLYDFSTLDDGSYYMVWEFIDGVNIQKWISKNGPVPPRLTVEIAIQALGGLEALHQMGIIHRDISPENIMLSQDHQGRLLAKVIDFGIAKQLSEHESGQGLTQTGMFLGKLKYASPEQAGFIREGEHLDARSDLYSFGIVLYEMLAGRAPFLATNPQGYILKHATEKPLPFAQANPKVSVPPALEGIVMRVLEKDRDARHATADELIEELKSVRESIAPDPKFGLGDRMMTLSSSPTMVDTRPTGASPTAGARPAPTLVDRGGTESGAAPTVVERSGSAATVVDHLATGAAPTVVESLGGAAPTVIESKFDTAAAATVIERLATAPPKTKKLMLGGGIAAAAALVITIVAIMLTRGADADLPTTTSIASITGTATTSTAPPARTSALILKGSLYAELEKIEQVGGGPIELSESDRGFPFRLDGLAPGSYRITYKDPNGKSMTQLKTIDGPLATVQVDFPEPVDLDDVVEDILKQ